MDVKNTWIEIIHKLQEKICASIEAQDGKAIFKEDQWERTEGGGGLTKIIANGNVFEKGGVNTSVVFGNVTAEMRKTLQINGEKWFAAGISVVLHPVNPFVPTVHCNYRMFELYDSDENLSDRWF
ncbi:MAG: coproporphyrinogen III oxidase, partial [Ferruginibacter sp.]